MDIEIGTERGEHRFFLHKFWGNFICTETEQAYRLASREELDQHLILAISISSLFFLIFIPVDVFHPGIGTEALTWIVVTRVFVAICGLAYYLYIRTKPPLGRQDLMGLAFGMILLTGFSLRTYFANYDSGVDATVGVSGFIILLGMYLFVFFPLLNMTFLGIFGAATLIGVSGVLFPLDSSSMIKVLLWSILVNCLGWVTARRNHRIARNEYRNFVLISEAKEDLETTVKERTSDKEIAEKANKDKSVFLAAASHDLRQPLQAMNLYLHSLKTANSEPENLKLVSNIERSASSLGNILDKLLDLSRLEAGVINIEKKTFTVSSMFDTLNAEFNKSADLQGLNLVFSPCSLEVNTDPILLEDILRNLIANAIKNTVSGRVLIGCRHKGADELQLQVWDTGKGIAKDQQEKIFDEFQQLGVNPGHAQQGLGLGLSIVQKVAGLLNHQVGILSEPGRGSMFSINVPVEHRSKVRPDDQAMTNIQIKPENLSIVVIDDDEDVLDALSTMLRKSHNSVVSVPWFDGLVKAEIIKFPKEKPDIIIADYRLEDNRTGVEAISNICGFYETDIPAIILTGDTAPERLQEISESGHSILHKPIQSDELLDQIQNVLSAALSAKGQIA